MRGLFRHFRGSSYDAMNSKRHCSIAVDIDFIVTLANGIWFFFDDPHELPPTVNIYPEPGARVYKHNRGRNCWAWIGVSRSGVRLSSLLVFPCLNHGEMIGSHRVLQYVKAKIPFFLSAYLR